MKGLVLFTVVFPVHSFEDGFEFDVRQGNSMTSNRGVTKEAQGPVLVPNFLRLLELLTNIESFLFHHSLRRKVKERRAIKLCFYFSSSTHSNNSRSKTSKTCTVDHRDRRFYLSVEYTCVRSRGGFNKRSPKSPRTMLLLETFKVRIFLKIENRWLAYIQMRYQLEPRRQSIDCDPQADR